MVTTMELERRKELETSGDACLTSEELEQGYHFCPEWDFMLVGPDDPERECCLCDDFRIIDA